MLPPELRQMADPGRIGRVLAPVPPQQLPPGQPRPARNGEIRLSISVRSRIAEEPRFVIAFRVAEAGMEEPTNFETPTEIVNYFASAAEQQIKEIDRLCPLSESQRSKLKLAAMGDMSRLMREVRELKVKYARNVTPNQAEFVALGNELAEVNANLIQNISRGGSMFNMVSASVLSPEQARAFVKAQFDQQFNQWRLKLSEVQREQLLELMLAQSGRLVDPIIFWEPQQCAAVLQSLDRGQLARFLEPTQIETIDRLRGEPQPQP